MKLLVVSMLCSLFFFSACTSASKNTYVLVHGAWQAAYVWDSVRSRLSAEGHRVIVAELPGHGSDTSAPHTLTMDVYRDKVIAALPDTKGKVILVGHSMGGMVISHVAEAVPDRIGKLVYIGAFLPASGQSLADLAATDAASRLGRSLVPSADQLTLDVLRDSLVTLFINDGSQAEKDRVLANYRAEPAIPFGSKVSLSTEKFGAVQKVYIKTLQDVVISPALQDRMIAQAGIKTVLEVNTSHSAFLSQPREVSNLLLRIGE